MRSVLRYLAVTASILAATAAAEARELRYNLFVPANTIEMRVLTAFFDELKAATNGSLTGRIFPGGQLLSGGATLKGIRDGVVDVGFIGPAFYPGELKHVNLVPDMVGYALDSHATMAAANDTIAVKCKECVEDYEKLGLIFLGGHTGTSWDLMCTKPGNKLADLKGRKVRTPGGAATRLVEALGLVSVNMSPSEAATALAGGQIDCVVGATSWLEDYSYWDTTKTVIDADLGLSAGLGIFVFNTKTFKEFTAAERAAIMRLMPKYLALMTQGYIDKEVEVTAKAAAKGVTFVKPDASIVEAMANYRRSEIPNIADGLRRRGVANPDKLLQDYQATLNRWKQLLDQKGRTPQAVAEAMRTEIYDKISLPK